MIDYLMRPPMNIKYGALYIELSNALRIAFKAFMQQ